MTEAFLNAKDAPEIFLACEGILPFQKGKIHVAPYFDFAALLPRAAVFIHHGGQNSIMAGLLHGVPQLICPGRFFKRRYNADIICENGAGIALELPQFTAGALRAAIRHLTTAPSYKAAATHSGEELAALGAHRPWFSICKAQAICKFCRLSFAAIPPEKCCGFADG